MTIKKKRKIQWICFSLAIILLWNSFVSPVISVQAKESEQVQTEQEFHAVWITYLEFSSKGYTEKAFQSHINTMFDRVKKLGVNAVIVQVRPFSDAFYPSKYFPWSKYVSGEQGKDPGFDPLAYMVEAAHKRGLEFHAWLNPYRVTSSGTDVTALAKNHPARKWLTDSKTSNDRYVLSYGDKLYYNPSITAVRTLIVNGVKEIVENYDVDGIHFDDYFYPTLGTNYTSIFDAKEYEAYKAKKIEEGKGYYGIVNWRRAQVNYLLQRVYKAIKEIDPDVVFGVSPEGYMPNLLKKDRHYTDVVKWMNTEGYIDYICPQIYFSFLDEKVAFDLCVDEWLSKREDSSKVKIYIGIPVYKAGSKDDIQFEKNSNILTDMIKYCRNSGGVDGYFYYRYEFFYTKATQPAVKKLLKLIKK